MVPMIKETKNKIMIWISRAGNLNKCLMGWKDFDKENYYNNIERISVALCKTCVSSSAHRAIHPSEILKHETHSWRTIDCLNFDHVKGWDRTTRGQLKKCGSSHSLPQRGHDGDGSDVRRQRVDEETNWRNKHFDSKFSSDKKDKKDGSESLGNSFTKMHVGDLGIGNKEKAYEIAESSSSVNDSKKWTKSKVEKEIFGRIFLAKRKHSWVQPCRSGKRNSMSHDIPCFTATEWCEQILSKKEYLRLSATISDRWRGNKNEEKTWETLRGKLNKLQKKSDELTSFYETLPRASIQGRKIGIPRTKHSNSWSYSCLRSEVVWLSWRNFS